MSMTNESYISTYRVGLFADLKNRRTIRSMRGRVWNHAKSGNWRAVRNYFNGYLAEWHYPPSGVAYYRCGKGWTRKAAIRKLGIHIAESNSPELNAK